MSKLTSLEKVELIKQLIKHKRDMDVFSEKFIDLFGGTPGCLGNGDCHYQVFDRLFNDYITMVAKEIGDSKEGINWFVWENDCGKEGLSFALDGDSMFETRTAEDYIGFLSMCEDENRKSEEGAEILSK